MHFLSGDNRSGPAGSLPGRYFCSDAGHPKPMRDISRHRLGSFPPKTRPVSEPPRRPLPGRRGGRSGPRRRAGSLPPPPSQPGRLLFPVLAPSPTLSPSRRELPATERPEARPTRSGGKMLDVSRPTVWLGDVAWPSELRTPLSFPPKAPLTPAGAGGLVSAIVC